MDLSDMNMTNDINHLRLGYTLLKNWILDSRVAAYKCTRCGCDTDEKLKVTYKWEIYVIYDVLVANTSEIPFGALPVQPWTVKSSRQKIIGLRKNTVIFRFKKTFFSQTI